MNSPMNMPGRHYLERKPERLVVTGFRAWMAGYETGDVDCWEVAWNLFATELGVQDGRRAIAELSHWVRTVHRVSCRRICCFPSGCRYVCRDECMAMSLIAACQHEDQLTARAAAFHLVGAAEFVDQTVDAAREFSVALTQAGQQLSELSSDMVASLGMGDPSRPVQ
jgi:hypothetical protein